MSEQHFIVELPLIVDEHEDRILGSRMTAGSRIFNAVLGEALACMDAMKRDAAWEAARKLPSGSKERSEAFHAVVEKYDFKSSRFNRSAIKHLRSGGFGDRLGAPETQAISDRAFDAVRKYCYGLAGRPRFKSVRRPLHSLEGKSNASGLRWRINTKSLEWKGLRLIPKLKNRKKDPYMDEALTRETARCRVIWRKHKDGRRWFLQLVQCGLPPKKRKVAHRKDSKVGLDHGPSQIAIVSKKAVALENFAPGVIQPWKEMRVLQRAQDRSQRASNPDNYDEKGRIKKGRKEWKKSKTFARRERKLAKKQAKLAGRRKTEHGNLINRILAQGRTIRIEKISHRGWQKTFGRSVGVRGPADFMNKLKRKAESAGGGVEFLDTRKLKLSQYDHITASYTKKPLSQRYHVLGDGNTVVQRDIYSAFLALCVEDNTHEASHIEKVWATTEPLLRQAALMFNQSATGKPSFPTVALPPSERIACKAGKSVGSDPARGASHVPGTRRHGSRKHQ